MPVAYKKCSHRAAACVCCLHNAVCCCVCCLHNGRVQTSAQPGSVWPIIAPDPRWIPPSCPTFKPSPRFNDCKCPSTCQLPLPAPLPQSRTELTDFSQKFPSFLRFLSLCLASIPILSDRLFYAASASRSGTERGGGSKIHTAWGGGMFKEKIDK